MPNKKRFLLMASAATGLFLSFTLFTAPLFPMIAFTPGGVVGHIQQASAQEAGTSSSPSPSSQPPTLPFTPFSLQQDQQEAVPQEEEQQQQQPSTEDGAQALREPGSIEAPNLSEETAPPPPTGADDDDGSLTAFRPRDDLSLTPQPNEPTTRQGGEGESGGGGSNTTMPSSADYQIVTHVRESSDGSRRAHCSTNSYRIGSITGGGFYFASPTVVFESSPYVVFESVPYGLPKRYDGWRALGPAGDEFKIFAVCAEIIASENAVNQTAPTSGSIYPATSVRISEVTIEPNGWKAAAAYCQEGEKIIGGGFGAYAFTIWNGDEVYTFDVDKIRVYKNYPSGGNAWAVEAKNDFQRLQVRLFVHAVCAKVTIADSVSEQIESSVRNGPLTVPPNSQNSVVASCREGETIIAGGWYSITSDTSVYKSYPSGNGWAVEAHNWDPTGSRSLIVHAMCARIVSTAQQITPATVPPSTGNATGTTTTPATNATVGEVTELTTTPPPSSSSSSSTELPLRVEAIANVTEAYAPATIRLDANITGGAPPYTYNWYVPGFGIIDQDRSIIQTFFEPGTFNYILTVTDSRGKVLTDNEPIVIYEPGDIVAPEPGGVAPPPQEGGALLEPAVPPSAVSEGEGDTGEELPPPGTIPPTDEEPDEGDTGVTTPPSTTIEEESPSLSGDDTGRG